MPRSTGPNGGDLDAGARFRIWFEIEAHAASAIAQLV